MDNIHVHADVVKWLREVYLPKKYQQSFHEKSLELQNKARIKFDAVSEDGEIVAVISTRTGYDSGGTKNEDDLQKTRSDALHFLILDYIPKERLMIFSEQSMIDLVKDEKKRDRFPTALKIIKVKLPPELAG